MNLDRQASLFDFTEQPAPSLSVSAALQISAHQIKLLSRWQKEFNTLSASVIQLRQALEQSQALVETYRAHVAAVYMPRVQALTQARRDWAMAADSLLQNQAALPKTKRLSRKRQIHLTECLFALVAELLAQHSDDAELADIHDRYSDISLQDARAAEKAQMQALMASILGSEAMQGHEADDLDALFRHAQETMAADADADTGTSARRPSQASLKREQAAKDISQSLRAVYRKLASSLHPDREPDPAERARKTALMQQANQAYAQDDLIQLLRLQRDELAADQHALARADDASLKLYCQALRTEQKTIKAEISATEAPLRHNLAHGRSLSLKTLQNQVDADAKQLKKNLASLRQGIEHLRNPALCGSAIDALELPDQAPDFAW